MKKKAGTVLAFALFCATAGSYLGTYFPSGLTV